MPPVKFPRQKRYKEKKASEDAAFKKDESDRINALQKRARASETEEEKKIRKEKNRLRMKAKREELRNKKTGGVRITNAGTLSPKSAHARKFGYRTSSSLGKAVRKILAETPSSPIMEAAKQAGLEVSPECSRRVVSPPKPIHNTLPDDVVEKVINFFTRPDIVWTSPSLKDEMTIWDESGKKQKLRKYYLEITIDEAYGIFKAENPDLKIGRSKFHDLRPPNAILMGNSPADQCKCPQHETFRMLLAPFKIQTETIDFWSLTICDVVDLSSDCWKNQCPDCKDGKTLMQRIEVSKTANNILEETLVSWHEWETEHSQTKGGKAISRQIKVPKGGSAIELVNKIRGSYPSYLAHVRRKRILNTEYLSDVAKDNYLVIQVDFAQDYNCKDNSREIGSAIYGRRNVTIFTCAVHYKNKWHSYAVLTDAEIYAISFIYIDTICFIHLKNDCKNLCITLRSVTHTQFQTKYLFLAVYFLATTWK